MNDNEETVDIDYDTLKHRTPKATLLIIDKEEIWLPNSQITVNEDENTVTMPEWLATDKGLT